jgi:hypothetical protein
MRPIGFSTGAIAKGNFRHALELLSKHDVSAVELSALRIGELAPLLAAIPVLDLRRFSFISIHAPSRFLIESEQYVIKQLASTADSNYPVVVHPDVLFTPALWVEFGDRLLIENMDKRKPIGRNVRELEPFFNQLPKARFCFDIGHARQVDPSMAEASCLLRMFRDRLAEVHISEVNTASRHDPISRNAMQAFQLVAGLIPHDIPIVLETLIDKGQSDISTQMRVAREALHHISVASV